MVRDPLSALTAALKLASICTGSPEIMKGFPIIILVELATLLLISMDSPLSFSSFIWCYKHFWFGLC